MYTIPEKDLKNFQQFDGSAYTDISRADYRGSIVAIRRWNRELSGDQVEKLYMLLDIWARLNHPNITKIFGVCHLDRNRWAAIVVPLYINGNITKCLERGVKLDVLKLLTQVASALKTAHSMSPAIIHGNVRGSNILISNYGDAHLTDFGLRELNPHGDIDTACRWLAPEILFPEDGPWASAAGDVYSFGMTMFEVSPIQ
ncbi:hypothetical protein JAAARDRAFT_81811 [Jaapia argillacea MUCL 33604]|uniref:Protein kinase domain-containing protein n=1 Tax=Jaapia argillacea MUCL 33604 TaxID=933084 RepID=A0A067P719_9AGAM|nr:hypothetical protein JAAARDRAFT_81811 [Jaapia argillacea MUCL 33604]